MRKASMWMSTLAVVALAAGCGSNFQRSDGTATSGAAGTSGAANVNGGRTLTLRGCVEDGVPPGTYVLRANGPVEGEGGAPAGTSGRAQETGQTDVNGTRSGRTPQDAGTYRLIATGNLDFGQNLGKEVTVTGEFASQARDNTVGTTGPAGGQDKGSQGSANDRRQRQGTSGQGDVQGDASNQNAAAKFLRVTSMNRVADSCEGR